MSNDDTNDKALYRQTVKDLKDKIKADAALCRKERDEARKELARGRAMLLSDRSAAMRIIRWAADEKKWAGDGRQRERLLAYGYLRGRSYKRIENHCREDNRPSVSDIAFQLPDEYTNVEAIRMWLRKGDLTREQVLVSMTPLRGELQYTGRRKTETSTIPTNFTSCSPG